MKTTKICKTYAWGKLRLLEHGASYKAVLHPEHWEIVKQGKGSFRDEQGLFWIVAKVEDGVVLRCESMKFSLSLAEIAALD